MGNSHRKCDAAHDPGMTYALTLYLRAAGEGGAPHDAKRAKYLRGGFARDVGEVLSGLYAFSDLAEVTAAGVVGLGKVVLNVRWKRNPDAGSVFAEDVAHQMCAELDWHDTRGSWPVSGDAGLVRLSKTKRWSVVVKDVLRYEYDGRPENYAAHEYLRMPIEEIMRRDRKRKREEKKKAMERAKSRSSARKAG